MNRSFMENYYASLINREKAWCKIKDVKTLGYDENGTITYTRSEMEARTKNGTHAKKIIEIDDKMGFVYEDITAESKGKNYEFINCDLTRYRCAEMTVLTIKQLAKDFKKVGFIGTGFTNLANCIAIHKNFGIEDIVIRGSKRNYAKNVGDFMTVCSNVSVDTSEDMRLLNQCDIVVVCTSCYKKNELISTKELYGPDLIVCLDCGYLLDESFRKERDILSDFPAQIKEHYKDEFPYDKKQYDFKQMEFGARNGDKAVAYLYGIAIADAVAAEELIRKIENDGMEEPFLKK